MLPVVLSVVRLQPTGSYHGTIGPLLTEEVIRNDGGPSKACNLNGLAAYFGGPIDGKGYNVFETVDPDASTGNRMPSLASFFSELLPRNVMSMIFIRISLEGALREL